MRRPLQLYPAALPGPIGYEDPLRRNQNYRVLKSHPSESGPSRNWDRVFSSEANVQIPPLSIATRPPEPIVYLTLDFEIAKASPSFTDSTGLNNIVGRKLIDIVTSHDRDRIRKLETQIKEEQHAAQPNYLPPILDRGQQILQGLGVGLDDVRRYQLEHQEYLSFSSVEGQSRPFLVRFGLAKEGSLYFVVALLTLTTSTRFPYPSPSPHGRDAVSSYHPQPHTPQAVFTQQTPVSATFEPPRSYVGDNPLIGRQPISHPSSLPGQSPGLSTGPSSSYTPTPTRPDFPGPSPTFQMPRSIAGANQASGPHSYQLPPIRTQSDEAQPRFSAGGDLLRREPLRDAQGHEYRAQRDRPREDRPSRVDIDGLIERADPSRDTR